MRVPKTLLAITAVVILAASAGATLSPQRSQFRADPELSFAQPRPARTLATRPDGEFIVVWEDQSYPAGIFGRLFDSTGEPIDSEFRVSPVEGSAYAPAVAAHEDGSFVIVWHGRSYDTGNDTLVFARRFDSDGEPVAAEFRVNSATAPYPSEPAVAALGTGEFVVAWTGSDYSGYPAEQNIFGRRFDSNGVPVGNDFTVDTLAAEQKRNANVASPGDGTFVVVWEAGSYGFGTSPDGAYFGISARRFGSMGPLGAEFVVNTFTPYSEFQPDVAVAPNGNFVVAWTTQYGDGGDGPTFDFSDSVTLRRYASTGVPLDDEVHLNEFTTGAQRRPAIAMAPDGSFVVVFESSSSYNSPDLRDPDGGVFGRCFNSDGSASGSDFQVNTYTTLQQFGADVACDGSGNFAVSWQGVTSDGFTNAGIGVGVNLFERVPPGTPGRLEVTKSDGEHRWGEGELITYQIDVTNNDDDSDDVTVREIVPLESRFDAGASSDGWDCENNGAPGALCTIEVVDVPGESIVSVDFAVRVLDETIPLWKLYNSTQGVGENTGARGTSADATEFGPCELSDFDPSICSALHFLDFSAVPRALMSGVRKVLGSRAVESATIGLRMLELRDRRLMQTRGGERLVDLYYDQSTNIVAAAMADSAVVTRGQELAAAVLPYVEAFAKGADDSLFITTRQLNIAKTFFSTLRAAGNAELRAVLDRELDRMDFDSFDGLPLEFAFDRLERLSCEGHEEDLFCGEVTGDCRVTATDALAVLRMAVGGDDPVDEADVDGNGAVNTTDALRTLRIGIGADPETDACNVV